MHPQSSTETCMVSGGAAHLLVFPFDSFFFFPLHQLFTGKAFTGRHFANTWSFVLYKARKIQSKDWQKVYEHYSNQIYLHYVLLIQNTSYQIHHLIIQRNLMSSLRFQAVLWNCYSYKPLSSWFLATEGNMAAIYLKTGADELGAFTKKKKQYNTVHEPVCLPNEHV